MPERRRQVFFNRTQGHIHFRGDLCLGQALHAMEPENALRLLRQFAERRGQLFHQLAPVGLVLRRRAIVRGLVTDPVPAQLLPRCIPAAGISERAQLIEVNIVGHSEQESCRIANLCFVRHARQAYIKILNDILSHGGISRQTREIAHEKHALLEIGFQQLGLRGGFQNRFSFPDKGFVASESATGKRRKPGRQKDDFFAIFFLRGFDEDGVISS